MASLLPPLGAGGGGAHTQPSLPSLPLHQQSDTHITAHLASRFHVSHPTARLSSHALVSINTYTSSSRGIDGGKEGSALAGAEDMANRAFLRLGHRSENQAILFLGESGSGKTTIRSHLLTSFLDKSSTPLSNKVSLAAYVFDALTTTKTATTPTASKAGLFLELQYDTASSTQPFLLGAKLLDHRIERSRITDVPTGERNFHVLYYLLAGTSAAEKEHLGLTEPQGPSRKKWKFLGHPTQLKVGINDAEAFQLFKTALRKLEFPRGDVAEICQVLASILHIGQLEFETTSSTTAMGDDSGGFSHEGSQTVTAVRNKDVLGIIAAFLGVSQADLETTLGYKTKMIHKERVTVLLDPAGARANANELARTVYSLLVAYVIESINQRICAPEEAIANTVSLVDFPGFAAQSSSASALDQLLNNAACEALYNLTLQNFFDRKADLLETEEVSVAATSYFDNSDAVKGLLKAGNGLLSILDDQTRRNRTDMQLLESLKKRFEGKNPAILVGSATAKLPGSNFFTENTAAVFTVKHFAGEVEYPFRGLVEENGEVISGDLLNLVNSSKNDFVQRLFGQEILQTVVHPKERTTVMQASVSSKPMRAPSIMSRHGRPPRPGAARMRAEQQQREQQREPQQEDHGAEAEASDGRRHTQQGASGQFLASLENVTKSVTAAGTNCYFVFCLKPNDRRIANQFDSKCVRSQVQTFGIAEISQRLRTADFSLFLPYAEFLGLAGGDAMLMSGEREKVELVLEEKQWPGNEVQVGSTGVFLSERVWMDMMQLGDARTGSFGGSDAMSPPDLAYGASKERLLQAGGDRKTGGGYFGSHEADARSEAGVSAAGGGGGGGDMFRNLGTRAQMAERGNEKSMVEVEEFKDSASRKRWVAVVYLLTFFVPDFLIGWVGRMRRKDVRMAWREKLAINILIWLCCAAAAFFIIGFPSLICPKQYVFSADELASHDGQGGSHAYAAIRGQVFDVTEYASHHYPPYLPSKMLTQYGGRDITPLFPVQVSAMCQGVNGTISDFVLLDARSTNITAADSATSDSLRRNAQYHDFRYFTSDPRPDWFTEQMMMLRKSGYKVGNVGYSPQYVATLGSNAKAIAMLDGRVYDLTAYLTGARGQEGKADGPQPSDANAINFMDPLVVDLFQQRAGQDVSDMWHALALSGPERKAMKLCLENLFYVGDVDTRNSVRCQFADYLVLGVSALMASVIVFKFLAALQFGSATTPEKLDKFIMCQVPAYTEDEDSLRRAVDSLARMHYDDKRKLLVVICDGMIIGQGNDRPTPRIVLDILGVSETVDPEPLSFESLGEGLKQHNMGKVYSGLYEVQGHIVPFLVVVKVGKPSEVSRPGNRGKRDSQMVVMRFLNRVHYNLAMSPLELDMYHHMRNVIGVNPTFYEYLLQVDADTVVAPDSATRFVSTFLDDTRLVAVCGETSLTNAKSSFVTMIQVYEYWISHNLTKAFESLFGSVTCLPGCFTVYRIRAAETGKPLFVSKDVVEAYATIRVDTLHMKNLLHLGEDRFLTTLLMRFHSKYKTKYISAAKAWTVAPDTWQIFLSQRRRWINSTVHNLMELMPMAQLCGFCCFSMRFVVFVDLLSTIVQPVVVAYIVYLIVLVVRNATVVPITAFLLLAAIYGLQAVIFIVRRRWEMIGWMIMYLAAVPVFSFALPLYAFWHMDDFNWGNTRVVAGERGKKIVISDEGKFDPASIPRKRWDEYQAELWDVQTHHDHHDDARSEASASAYSYTTKAARAQTPVPPLAAADAHSHWGGTAAGGLPSSSGAMLPHSRPASHAGFRLSLAASELGLGGGAASTFGTSPLPHQQQQQQQQQDAVELSNLPGLPGDDALLAEIRDVLRTADLMTVTKKGVKQELERRFGVSLDARRAYINSATEALLSGQL